MGKNNKQNIWKMPAANIEKMPANRVGYLPNNCYFCIFN